MRAGFDCCCACAERLSAMSQAQRVRRKKRLFLVLAIANPKPVLSPSTLLRINHDDRDCRCRAVEYGHHTRIACDDYVDIESNQLGYQLGKPIRLVLGKAPLNQNVAAFYITKLYQPSAKRFPRRRSRISGQVANAWKFFCLLRFQRLVKRKEQSAKRRRKD